MYRNEIIEVISSNNNKELNNWYYPNIKSLTKFLVDKLEPKNILKIEPENNMLNIPSEIPEKVVSKWKSHSMPEYHPISRQKRTTVFHHN